MSESEPSRDKGIERSSGGTPAERYLSRLCEGTFLSLWSYPQLYRDQGARGGKEGKEIADLIVVFEKDIVIFSDKHCKVPSSGNVEADWRRWFRRAVEKAANQAWGAERWIRKFPTRLFLDRNCTKSFPYGLPGMADARFHLLVVAHDISARCAEMLGGSGSLMIRSDLKGLEKHTVPFTIGDLQPDRSFIHVLDDTSLNIILRTLDTISDFTAYLTRKERLLRSGAEIFAAGEEELLAMYLKRMGPDGFHDFDFPADATGIALAEGHWEAFERHAQFQAKREADRVSYVWDRLIETFNRHALKGTQYRVSAGGLQTTERIMRLMAREPRVRRRMLGGALMDLVTKAPSQLRAARVMKPSRAGDPYYVFLLLPVPEDRPYDEYRDVRGKLLEVYCQVTKLRCPDAEDIVGIATEPGMKATRSEDALYLDAREWNEQANEEARKLQTELQILTNVSEKYETTKEYPDVSEDIRGAISAGRNPRNKPCPCGSGKKYKRCHGR